MNKQELFGAFDKYKEWVNYLEELGMTTDVSNLKNIFDKEFEKFSAISLEDEKEPNDLESIKKLSHFELCKIKEVKDFSKRIKGAFMGRAAGCTLGAPVEGWQIEGMKTYAEINGLTFPPVDYWTKVVNPDGIQYERSKRIEFTKDGMDGIPSDDDVMYPMLNMMLIEKYGKDFTTKEVGEHWLNNMTVCCTAEYEAMENLKKGVDAKLAANNNPYIEWIGAAIRADAFGWACPGNPAKAAEMAYYDAFLSHRRNGIYGEMYFAAVIAEAFVSNSIKEALEEGLKVIPTTCRLYEDIKWALDKAPEIHNYLEARKAVDERFPTLFWVHVRNNTCLCILALLLCGDDFTKLISQTVAMGHDNDCTAATVGSIFGAFYGIDKIDPKWYEKFGNTLKCFLQHDKTFYIDDVLNRLEKVSKL